MKMRMFLLIVLLSACVHKADARGAIIYSLGEEIEKVMSLPYSEEYTVEASDGRYYHADLGIIHDQFSLFWIPLINYGTEKYVLYTDTKVGDYDQTYVELDSEEIQYLQQHFSDIPTKPELPFWDAWGGKLLALAIIAFYFFVVRD